MSKLPSEIYFDKFREKHQNDQLNDYLNSENSLTKVIISKQEAINKIIRPFNTELLSYCYVACNSGTRNLPLF